MKLTICITACFLTLLCTQGANAQQLGPTSFKTVVVETVLPFSVRAYQPTFILPEVKRTLGGNFLAPEDAISAFFGSLRAADYQWNETTWTRFSREFNSRKNAESGLIAKDWEARWSKQFSDKKIELLSRIDYDKYVILEYQATVASTGQITETDTLVLEREGDSWLLTQALVDNPITFAWKTSGKRLQLGPNTVGRLAKKP